MAKKRIKKKTSCSITTRKKRVVKASSTDNLLGDIRSLIDESRASVARTVNAGLVWLYWNIGKRIREDVLQNKRAGYGDEIVAALSRGLTAEYGNGFSHSNLSRMVKMAEYFPDDKIVVTLSQQLSWSHFLAILPLDDSLKREFYTEMCRLERWTVRTLRQKVDRLLFERTAVSKKPDELIAHDLEALRDEDRLTPDLVFRDPYFLDFLGLSNERDERDIENAILRELEAFILELGSDFAFLARQKRVTVDSEDYYLDLLFYHRRLRRLVAIDLTLGKFQAADKGQMELYLRWLEENEMQTGEEPPIGLILCAEKSEEHVKLLRLSDSGIRVASYLTELPPRKLLERKLHDAIQIARQRLAHQTKHNE